MKCFTQEELEVVQSKVREARLRVGLVQDWKGDPRKNHLLVEALENLADCEKILKRMISNEDDNSHGNRG